MKDEFLKSPCFVAPASWEKEEMLKMRNKISTGLDLRLINNGHMSCGRCGCNKFNVIKCDGTVCVGCAKCSWECYVYIDRYGVEKPIMDDSMLQEEEYSRGKTIPVVNLKVN